MLSEDRKNRIKELIERSYQRGIFTYSDFLSPTSVAEIIEYFRGEEITAFGGVDYAERKILRFGNSENFYSEKEFPITLIEIVLTGGKFATAITHRDVLGAILNLGIERQKLGDIFVNGNFAYVVAHSLVVPLILSELKKVGRNSVTVKVVDFFPEDVAPSKTEREFTVSSNRIDGIICKVFNLSRESGVNLCKSGLVSVNGKIIEQAGRSLNISETVAVKGYGKFTFLGESGISKKGKLYVTVEVFN